MLLFFSTALYAQISDSSKPDILIESIISKFNENQFKEIYALADSGFKANIPERDIVSLLTSASTLGKIKKYELVLVEDGNYTYRLFFERKSLLMDITPISNVAFGRFGLRPYKLPVDKTREQFQYVNPLKSHLDSVVQQSVTAYMNTKNVAGLSVGILVNDEMLTYNFGETKKGNNTLPTGNTIYEIGSITKVFTGILLANAVIENKVRLDDDIRKYLTGNYPNLEYSGKPIRLVNLSNHTSGLPFTTRLPDTNEDPFNPSFQFNDSIFIRILHSVKLDTLPGIQRSYSNLGVAILGQILEKVYGLSYEKLIKKYILNPFGMYQTKVLLSTNELNKMAKGYDMEGNETNYWQNKLAEPVGGIHSTVSDMLLFIKKQVYETDSASNLSHIPTFGNTKEGVGLNWDVYTTKKGYLRWAHDGGTDGFTSLCMIYPEIKSGFVLLTNNGDHDDEAFNNIALAIYFALIEKKK
jgi:CubicO group peptidase (beta-lactamase class C family)